MVQINAVDPAYTGGLAFGMTVCDPSKLKPIELPDDSDLLIDRPEYWVVFKNVCTNPEIGDELSFHLAETGTSNFKIIMIKSVWISLDISRYCIK